MAQVVSSQLGFGKDEKYARFGIRAARESSSDSGSNSDSELDLPVPLDVLGKVDKILADEESQALLKDLAAAAERVTKARAELDDVARKERQLMELKLQLQQEDATAEEAEAAAKVSKVEREVEEAEREVRAAERALVEARAGLGGGSDGGGLGGLLQLVGGLGLGGSNSPQTINAGSLDRPQGESTPPTTRKFSKWETADIDDAAERIQSLKAAAVGGGVGLLASLPIALASGVGGASTTLGAAFSEAALVTTCLLFGVTYRYIVRRDFNNTHLKGGAVGAFALARGLAQVDTAQSLADFSVSGTATLLQAALSAGVSTLVLAFVAVALDYCLLQEVLQPFPSRKAPPPSSD
eukprot:jgi/Mesen1/6149/ME000314S05163